MQFHVIFPIFKWLDAIIKNNKLRKWQFEQLFSINVQVILFNIAFVLFVEINHIIDCEKNQFVCIVITGLVQCVVQFKQNGAFIEDPAE